MYAFEYFVNLNGALLKPGFVWGSCFGIKEKDQFVVGKTDTYKKQCTHLPLPHHHTAPLMPFSYLLLILFHHQT